MATAKAAKLNMGYMYLPTAMLAKVPQPKSSATVSDSDARIIADIFGHEQNTENVAVTDTGAEHFIPKNGKKRYSGNCVLLTGIINKIRSTFGSRIKITHKLLEDEANISHVTVNHALKLLRDDDVLERKGGVSDYYINSDIEFSEKDYITIYSFLSEEINFGGVVKKLTVNAALYLCFMLRHYYNVKEKAAEAGRNNIKPEEAYFLGGKQRVASTLNIPESTANDVIWELLNTKCIHRYALDENGNICKGKGNSRSKETVYVLRSKVIRACNKVRTEMDAAKEKRQKAALRAEEAALRAAERKERAEAKKARKAAQSDDGYTAIAKQRQRDYDALKSLHDKYAAQEADIRSQDNVTELPEPFEVFSQHGGQPPTDKLNK